MKIIIRIAVLLLAVLLIFYFMEDRIRENDPLEAPVKQGTAVPVEHKGVGSAIPQTSRPEEGLSIYVGKPVDTLIEAIGKPDRIEPSSYQYDWWIYLNQNLMVGVSSKGIVNQLYTGNQSANVTPFEMNQDINEIYRFTIVGSEVDVMLGDNIYTFSLNSEDMQTRPLIIYKELFAQLYIDQEEHSLQGVRFIDPATLVLHQPYEMTYMGELLLPKPPSSIQQIEVNRTTERQIFELTNRQRVKHNLSELKSNYTLNEFAHHHSEKLALGNNLQEDEDYDGTLSHRLKNASIEHKKAGENTAFDYGDAIEAVHGWLNSAEHRKVMLDKDFTHLGTGVYGNYYTETFIKTTVDDKRQE